jgi:hypothetical protein
MPQSARIIASEKYNAVKSDSFVAFMVAASKEGSKAKLTAAYAESLTRVFDFRAGVLTGKMTAHEALSAAAEALFDKFGEGRGEYSRHVDISEEGVLYGEAPKMPDLNREAAEYHARLNSVPATCESKKKRLI